MTTVGVLAPARVSFANGRYPAASLLAFDPIDPSHYVLAVTFGLLETHDSGKTFLWRCESALQVANEQDLMVAITASGATVAAKFDGIARTTDGCSIEFPAELAGKNMGDLALVKSSPHEVVAFSSDLMISGGFDSLVFHSVDDGATWSPLGNPFPTDFLPLTIDSAPSDGRRVYVSGRLGAADGNASALLRSDDGGATFTRQMIPGTENHYIAYIAAVHSTNPSRVYVRRWEPDGASLLMTDDGGATFRPVFKGHDQLLVFALSPDGNEIAFGGPGDGIWIGAADGTGATRRSDVPSNCLAWTSDGIFACADQATSPFSLGRSRDHAATFETILRFDSLCGATGCPTSSLTAKMCATDWQIVGGTVGSTCGADAGRDAAVPDGAADSGATGADGEPASEAGDAEETQSPGGSGCGCRVRARGGSSQWAWVLATAWLGARRLQRRRYGRGVIFA